MVSQLKRTLEHLNKNIKKSNYFKAKVRKTFSIDDNDDAAAEWQLYD